MGGPLSNARRPFMFEQPRHNRRIHIVRHGHPNDPILPENWKANDLVYQYLNSEREMQMTNDPGNIMMTIAMYSPCKNSRCKCKAGIFVRDKCNTVGWADINCTRSGCNHSLSNHIQHIKYVSNTEYMAVIKLVFDINNIKASLKIAYAKPKFQRNLLIEGVYETVYKILCKKMRCDPFKAPNIDTIYGSPPFEQISIQQILLNFHVFFFCTNKEVLTFKQALVITKFLLHSFNSWIWTVPDKKSDFSPYMYSNPYDYYYSRYMIYCEMPRLIHSISPRYKATSIFGGDVLKYTLESFYKELQVWCFKSNIMWDKHTNLYCMKYLPIYMSILKEEVFNCNSLIWNSDFCISDVIAVYKLYEKL